MGALDARDQPPFDISKRQPQGDTRLTPEDKRLAVTRHATKITEWRTVFDANSALRS